MYQLVEVDGRVKIARSVSWVGSSLKSSQSFLLYPTQTISLLTSNPDLRAPRDTDSHGLSISITSNSHGRTGLPFGAHRPSCLSVDLHQFAHERVVVVVVVATMHEDDCCLWRLWIDGTGMCLPSTQKWRQSDWLDEVCHVIRRIQLAPILRRGTDRWNSCCNIGEFSS